jgi:hypothetical protein
MNATVRWVVLVLAAALVVCLLGWARGGEHHRGDEVGAFGVRYAAPQVLER